MTHLKKTALILITLLMIPFAANAATYKKMVVFGDSLSDHGNLHAIFNAAPVTWSNGDVWVDYLASNWGVTSANLINKAYGGGMTSGHLNVYNYQNDGDASNDAYIPSLQALGLKEQVALWVAGSPQVDSANTLFCIWIGANDLDQYLTRQAAGDTTLPSVQTFIQTAVTRVKDAMVQLSGAGARHFLVLNIPALGATPKLAVQPQIVKDAATNLARQFNLALQTAIEQGLSTLNASGNAHTLDQFDTFTFLNNVIEEGTFPNTTGTLVVLDSNGDLTSTLNTPASDYLFWDAIHPTTKAHRMLADKVKDQLADGSSGCFINAAGF